eukprot:TRINITY_DN14088_c0_g1_i1.p1 TRINITY_DN14088_c0_g1~~TRINITY_DN14088_c0_g1_i1.p1  ORF type:complete len:708 (-),score=296.93 TRINITY_DN14088_c0_g1_i1:159-2282(-)
MRRLHPLIPWLAVAQIGPCSGTTSSANPITKVITMLQALQAKVEQTGKEESAIFDKFMCYCQSAEDDLKKSIADAEAKIPLVESSLKELVAEKDQLTSDIAQHKKDRQEAQTSLDEAKEARSAAEAEFTKEKNEDEANIEAMGKAVAALEKGMASSFLQTDAAATLRRFAASNTLSDAERDLLSNFLSTSDGDDEAAGYSSQGGEILGILKQLKESTEIDLQQAIKDEESAKKEFQALAEAKGSEISTLSKVIEDKSKRLGEVGTEIVTAEEDLDNTKRSLAEDQKFFADLTKDCTAQKDGWQVRLQTRQDELVAIQDTMKILNDGETANLFKGTFPTPSLLQVRAATNAARHKAWSLLQVGAQSGARSGDRRLKVLAMTLHGKHANFEKVLKMTENMVKVLKEEQQADDDKKAYCTKELDENEDKKKALENDISDLDKAIDAGKINIGTVTEEIGRIGKAIAQLDKEVAEATEIRKEENSAFLEEMSSSRAARDLLFIAKQRLAKFYNAKFAQMDAKTAPAKNDVMQTFSFTQTGMMRRVHHRRAKPPPPPATFGDYNKDTQESKGVLGMIDTLLADLEKAETEAKAAEKQAQRTYEEFLSDSQELRREDSKIIAEKEGVKADAEAKLLRDQKMKKSKVSEAAATREFIANLHNQCDFLLQNYDFRKMARTSEIDSLHSARAVLSGADASFLQLSSVRRHLRSTAP